MGFGPGTRGCARRGPVVGGDEPDFRRIECCIGAGESRRALVFVPGSTSNQRWRYSTRCYSWFSCRIDIIVSKYSKKGPDTAPEYIFRHAFFSLPLIAFLTSVTKRCKHVFSSAHSQAKQSLTPQLSPSHISHISTHQGMVSPQIPSWLISAGSPGWYFHRHNRGSLQLSDEQVTQLFRQERQELWMQSKSYRRPQYLHMLIISGRAQRHANTSRDAAGPSRAPSRAPSQAPFPTPTQPIIRK
jgi:hypothetical protein